ncbi:Hexose transporter [Mycena indigotica]|uniref:Hexose transporter n=1 Tax=Mycena indigotica TaxID=2126181 RepID=A0A8H6W4Y0_9AGAR|nr:Hexose transporter [Mycena indigotica]KAF7301938.1 Hexose transporter [Mycena indigotica]
MTSNSIHKAQNPKLNSVYPHAMSAPRGTSSEDAIVSQLAAEDTIPWYKKPNLRYLYLLLFPTCIGVEMTSGFDSSMLNGLQAVDSWDTFFHSPRSTLLGLMSSAYSLGAIIALPAVSYVNDTFGRRKAIIFGSMFMLLGAALQTAAHNFAMFVCSRIILGLGIPFAVVAAASLIAELSHPKERARMGSLFNSCFFIGSIVAAGVTLGTFSMPSNWGWRIPSLLQLTPSLIQLIFIPFLPESPRWLIEQGRGDEARAILEKYHGEGINGEEFVKAEYAQIEKTLEMERESRSITWLQFIKARGMQKRVLVASGLGLFTQWSGNGLTSYLLARILDQIGIHSNRTKNKINLALTCWGFVNATFFALTVSKFRRRTIYLTCTVSLFLVFTSWTISSARYVQTGSDAASKAVLAFITLYSPAYNIGYNALTYTFLVELFPYHARAKGITIFQWWGRGASFFNQFVNPIGLARSGWRFYISYVVWLAFEILFVYFLFPETSNRTLEELAFLYEGDEMRKEQARRVEMEVGAAAVQSIEKVEEKQSSEGGK